MNPQNLPKSEVGGTTHVASVSWLGSCGLWTPLSALGSLSRSILNPLYQQFLSVLPSKYIPNLNYFYHVHHHLLPKPQALPGISIPALVSLQAIFHPASRTTFKCILDNFISQFKTFCSFVLCFNKNQISYLSPQSPALIPLRNFLPLSASS